MAASRFKSPARTLRRRRASVLLIVVVLLLMLAILGTSYLSTTRVDRVTSAQDVTNSQIDTIVDSVRDLASSYIVNSLFAYTNSGYQYRGATNANTITPYNNYDIPDYLANGTGDAWLADRVPQVPTFGAPASSGNLPYWPAITAPMNSLGIAGFYSPGGAAVFESPVPPAGATIVATTVAPFTYTAHTNLQPTFYGVTNGSGVTTYYPAFTLPSPNTPANAVAGISTINGQSISIGNSALVIAGDADGDGIADCGLIRLPGVYADGLTYYAGIRIIDNNSAINANTAIDNSADSALTGGAPTYFSGANPLSYAFGFFPANVGLTEFLAAPTTGAEIPNATQYHLNGHLSSQVSTTMYQDDGQTAIPGLPPVDAWSSVGDLLTAQMAHRMGNPGYVMVGFRAQPIPLGDQVDLAYHGGLFANPQTFSTTAGTVNPYPQSVIDTLLYDSTFHTAANLNGYATPAYSGLTQNSTSYPYSANAVYNWFNYNYAYAFPSGPVAMPTVPSSLTIPPASPTDGNPRPLLVVRNPVSNAAPIPDPDSPNQSVGNAAMPPYGNLGRWQATVSYHSGDIVSYNSQYYSCTGIPTGAAPFSPPGSDPAWTAIATWQAGSYKQNQVVAYGINNSYPTTGFGITVSLGTNSFPLSARYYKALATTTTDPTTPAGASTWTLLPPAVATKTCVNTAGFPELFRAYWDAMFASCNGDPTSTPFGNEPTYPVNNYPTNQYFGDATYTGNQFAQATAQTPGGVVALSQSSFACNPAQHRQRMFRSSLRDPTNTAASLYLPAPQEMQLRAALAAVNTLNQRSHTDSIGIDVQLTAVASNTPIAVTARVYGISSKQVYITEVYCNTDNKTVNSKPYVAIKIYNPTSATVPLNKWELVFIPRPSTGTLPYSLTLTGLNGSTAPPTPSTPFTIAIPANGYALIDNFDAGAVNHRPGETGLSATDPTPQAYTTGGGYSALPANFVYQSVAGLDTLLGGELVLMKPPSESSPPANLVDYIPIDSFDFTGVSTSGFTAWHYARGDATPFAGDYLYPGRYDGSVAANTPRQQGTQVATWSNALGQIDPWDLTTTPPGIPPTTGGIPFTLGAITVQPTFPTGTVGASPSAAFPGPTFPISLIQPQITSNRIVQSPQNAWPSAGGTSFPYGGFARNGDILMVPFFGAYRIEDGTGHLLELNSAPIDSAFADDSVAVDDIANYDVTRQQGRFSPTLHDLSGYVSAGVSATGPKASGATVTDPNLPAGPQGAYFASNAAAQTWAGYDLLVTGGSAVTPGQLRHVTIWNPGSLTLDYPLNGTGPCSYALIAPGSWTSHILDYLTVYSPQDDYLPNTDPQANATNIPVANDNSAVNPSNSSNEDNVGVEGLININTAPWRVLASLPLVMTNTSPPTVDALNSANVAYQIVQDRQKYGPFKTIFDLNRVYGTPTAGATDEFEIPGFRNGWHTITTTLNGFTGSSGTNLGDIATLSASGTGLPNQFDELNLQVTRLSNLITTRSDTFTVYIVVEGWQNAGVVPPYTAANPAPTLVVTRRAAFIVDRNTVTPTSRVVRTTTVPNN